MDRFEAMKKILLLLCLIATCEGPLFSSTSASLDGDAAFRRLSDEYISGYLAWRPQTGTTLGFHQYDGKVTDFSRASLDQELARLKSFESRLTQLDPMRLTARTRYDYQILLNAVKREIFAFEEMEIYSRNPMTYSTVLDVNIYIKRNFA